MVVFTFFYKSAVLCKSNWCCVRKEIIGFLAIIAYENCYIIVKKFTTYSIFRNTFLQLLTMQQREKSINQEHILSVNLFQNGETLLAEAGKM